MQSAIKQMETFQNASNKVSSTLNPHICVRKPSLKGLSPRDLLIKTNWDADVNSSSQSVGLGGVVRNSVRAILVIVCSKLPTNLQPDTAEVCTLRKVMSMCWDLNLSNIVFEGDCQYVVQAVYYSKDAANEPSSILYDIRFMLQRA